MNIEKWANIAGFEGKYQVSCVGRVKSLGNRKGCRLDRTLKPKFDQDGYAMVDLGKFHRNKRVHRLVAAAFIPNAKQLQTINHLDGDKRNNRVTNLEWCTSGDNTRHALATGLSQVRGSANGNSRLVEDDVRHIHALRRKGRTLREIGNKFNVAECTVSAIIKGRIWAHMRDP